VSGGWAGIWGGGGGIRQNGSLRGGQQTLPMKNIL
jgi:hypothetical protein